MLLLKLSSHFDSYNYCHKIIKVSFGKHNVGRCILSQSKGLGPKNFPRGFAPRPLQPSAPQFVLATLPQNIHEILPIVHFKCQCPARGPHPLAAPGPGLALGGPVKTTGQSLSIAPCGIVPVVWYSRIVIRKYSSM